MEWIIAGIIITLVVAGIIFWVVPEIIKEGKQASLRESCKTSVLLRAKSKILGKPILDDLKCETNALSIDSKNEVIIKEQIATEMFSCWYMFGKGEKDFLSDTDFGKGDNWCHICSRIDFNDKVQTEIPKINNFDGYLRDTEIPILGETFYSYIYGEENSKVIDPLSSGIDLKTDETNYVVFFADKRKDFWEDFGSIDKTEIATVIGGCLAGGKAGSVIGSVVGTPGVGTLAGAVIGCGSGMLIGYTVEAVGRKTDYISALYVGNSNKVIEICGQ